MTIEQMSARGVLHFVKSELKNDFQSDIYRNWFEEISLIGEDGDHRILGVPNDFASIWIIDDYKDMTAKSCKWPLANGSK
jgi:chromosomal replication initiation ATPase DnaA